MPMFNIVVRPPKALDRKADSKHLEVKNWPVVPQKGQEINLGPHGVTGVDVRVINVKHWLGCDDIDVYCEIETVGNAIQEFLSLTTEDGWKN